MAREEVRMTLHVPLTKFMGLVRKGQYASASSGERAAYLLALRVVEDVPSLDDTALEGLEAFIQFAKCHPSSAQDLLDMTLRAKGGHGG